MFCAYFRNIKTWLWYRGDFSNFLAISKQARWDKASTDLAARIGAVLRHTSNPKCKRVCRALRYWVMRNKQRAIADSNCRWNLGNGMTATAISAKSTVTTVGIASSSLDVWDFFCRVAGPSANDTGYWVLRRYGCGPCCVLYCLKVRSKS